MAAQRDTVGAGAPGGGRRPTLEIHHEPGPPRLTVAVQQDTRVCTLEVSRAGDGKILHADGWVLNVTRPPGAGEWWFQDDRYELSASVHRQQPLGERALVTIDGEEFRLVPAGGWRRRWSVRDHAGREVIELLQRRFTRPVHDLVVRSGDLPPHLRWVVSWMLAERLSRGQAATRHPRWGTGS